MSEQSPLQQPHQSDQGIAYQTPQTPSISGEGRIEDSGIDRSTGINSEPDITPQMQVGDSALSTEVDISPAGKLGVVDGEFTVVRSDGSKENGWIVEKSLWRDANGNIKVTITKPNPDVEGDTLEKIVSASKFRGWQESNQSTDNSNDPQIDLGESQVNREIVRIQDDVEKIHEDLKELIKGIPVEHRVTLWDFAVKSARREEVADQFDDGKLGHTGHRNVESAIAAAMDAERKVPKELHDQAAEYRRLMVNKYRLQKTLNQYM